MLLKEINILWIINIIVNKTESERMKLTPILTHICWRFYFWVQTLVSPQCCKQGYMSALLQRPAEWLFLYYLFAYCSKVSLVDCNCFHISIFGILAKCQWSANDTDVVIPLWESVAFQSWTWLSSWNAHESKKLNPWVRCAMFIFDL